MGQKPGKDKKESTGTLTANPPDIVVMVYLGHGHTVDAAFREARRAYPKIRLDRTTFVTTYVYDKRTRAVKPMYEAYFEGNEAQYRMYLEGK